MDTIAKLLPEGLLPAELTTQLQEAFDKKVAEAREQAEVAVREELAARYEHDKAIMVEAMDRMITDVVQKHEAEKVAAVEQFVEARDAFRKALKECRRELRTKLSENMKATRAFVTEQLTKEIVKLREQKKALVAEKLATAEKLAQMKESLAAEQAARLAKIDEFVVRQVSKELKEFAEDHRALVETRVKLVAESRKRLRETQSRFVKEAARTVEKVVTESLKREMTQLHEDIERNRQNMFGRRIFEAVAAEFMTSYLAEGTEIRKLQKVLEAKEKEIAEAKAKLDEAVKEGQIAQRRAKLAEDRAARSKVMGELLSNLRGEKRAVMEGMLETVKTEALRETFNKLLPVVLDETTRRAPAQNKTVLNEQNKRPAAKPTTVVTGDQRANRLFEAAQAESEIDNEIAEVVRLAGIVTK